jgi:ABC-type polysaccharide/polyol phosphate export permease
VSKAVADVSRATRSAAPAKGRRPRLGTRQARVDNLAIAWQLAKLDLARRYTPSFLGMLWGILSPLCMAGIIGTVFGKLFALDMRAFLPYLFLNLTMWSFLAGSVDGGAIAFVAAEGYIKQIAKVSFFTYPLRMVIATFLMLLLALVAVVVVALALGRPFNWTWIWLIPGLAAWFAFGFGVACLVGVINTAFRDFQHIQGLVLQVMFYVTPVIFPAQLLADHGLSWLLRWNPLYHLLMLVQYPLIHGESPPPGHLVAVALTLVATVGAGVLTVQLARRRLVFWL